MSFTIRFPRRRAFRTRSGRPSLTSLVVLNLSLVLQTFAIPVRQQTAPAAPSAERFSNPGQYAERLRKFEEFVKTQMERDKIPGLSIGFIKDEFIWARGFGYGDLENKVPATADSVYRLASVTKPMTAIAVLKLVEQNKIDLDAEIQTYVPAYPKQKWPVTVRQLLTHLGGGQTGSGLGAERKTVEQVVELIGKHPIETQPGTKFVYTTSGYNLLGAAVEKASGQSFEEFLRKRIFLPLDMTETRMDNPNDVVPARVRGYELVKNQIKNAEFVDVSTRFGGGGTSGTVIDLLRFARGLNQGVVLDKKTVELMYTPVASSDGRYWNYTDGGWDYGLGWFVSPLNGRFTAHHDGGQKGTTTALLRFPSENFAIAFACNLENVEKWLYIRRLFEAVSDEPWSIPVYARNDNDRATLTAMQDTFNYGSLYYDKTGQLLTANEKELASAFEYFRSSVNKTSPAVSSKAIELSIANGRHPIGGQSFVKVGSYMAAKLKAKYGSERLRSYHTTGAIAFFGDYVEMYRSDPTIRKEFRFDSQFEQRAAKWSDDWKRAWGPEIRALHRDIGKDGPGTIEKLRAAFAGADVYPSFVPQLMGIQNGGLEVVKAAKLAFDLYPRSDRTLGNWAIILLAIGDKLPDVKEIVGDATDYLAYLKRSSEINPDGVASARVLNEIANNWSNDQAAYRMDRAMGVARAAIELYPKNAALHDTAGNILLKKGEKANAVVEYRKALELDPAHEHASRMLKKLTADTDAARGAIDAKDLEAFLDQFFAEQMAELHVPGAVVTVVKDGRQLFTKGYGYADVEKKVPVSSNKTLFRAYSVSKSFTATAVMQLVERGSLRLDEDVNKYLKTFQLKGDFKEPVTLAHLMTHTGGFVDTDAPALFAHGEFKSPTLGENLAKHMPPRAKPLGTFRYSNYGASLGGHVVESVSGEPFAAYMERHILKPLGMKHSTFLLPYQLAPNVSSQVAIGYRYENGTYKRMRDDEGDFWTAPAANLLVTGEDMARFMIAHLRRGKYGDARILSEASALEMQRPRIIGESPLMPLGFFSHFENSEQGIYHNGGWDGAISQMFLLPEHDTGWFVSYTFGGDVRRQLRWRLLSAMLDKYFPE